LIKSLSISNFAIIDYVEVNFHKGMTTITGETGAGKSIILGALSLVLGKRADLSILKDSSKKCIVEATFDISKYNLKTFFDVENIDYLDETILRRELIPTGKSRAFINDTPVNLQILNVISSNLIDINNQNETHTFFNKSFQFKFLDSLSDTIDNSSQFRSKYREMKTLITSNEKLIKIYDTGIRDHDYQKFLYEELVSLDLNKDSLNKLEDEVNELSNVYDLKSKLSFCVNSIDSDENGILTRLGEVLTNLSSSETFSNNVSTYYSRINSLYIELKDVVNDIEIYKESLEYNPELLNIKNEKLDKIYSLLKKHKVSSVDQLIEEKDKLSKGFFDNTSLLKKIEEVRNIISQKNEFLLKLSEKINEKRFKAIPEIQKQLNSILSKLGMKNAKFKINLLPIDELNEYGKAKLELLFSSNLGSEFKPIKKIISGGELSRILLSIKFMISRKCSLPTIIFDEIDSGVSGTVANQIAVLMHSMSASNQIFAITHIPQVASKGDKHIKVYKEVIKSETHTKIKDLTIKEREIEIASMLSGKKITSSAIKHARELLD
tara:strand:- start:3001 stop:4653 length:1653 start_codon:yes stop_codon:yes gene_type:complete